MLALPRTSTRMAVVLWSLWSFGLGFGQSSSPPAGEPVARLLTLAEKGDVNAQVKLGQIYKKGQGIIQDYDQAVRWFRQAAETGDPTAQCELGAMYTAGFGVRKDDVAAAAWYRKAAEQGDATGQGALGAAYGLGIGVPRDYTEAFRWYLSAAEQGVDLVHATSQYLLGLAYFRGQGVPQNFIRAHMWLNLAAAHVNAEVLRKQFMIWRDEVAQQMTSDQIIEAQRLAGEWKPKKAQVK
jgi:hypothetical protein